MGGSDRRTSARSTEPAQRLADRYELIRLIGRGGMSRVYLARDTRLGRRVAIKVLLKLDPVHHARFEVEARATAQLSHENIVALHDIGTHRGRPYMVLEYVPGKTLSAWLRERRAHPALPAPRAAELVLPVARALQCAHDAGIVHRDLKPGNIMLADNGTIKVLDFGIAKFFDPAAPARPDDAASPLPELEPAPDAIPEAVNPADTDSARITRIGILIGTMSYMAPEQWRAEPIDGRADLWALGVILHELVTGEHPLGSRSQDVLRTVGELDQPMPRLRDLRPELGRLGELIDRCLIKPRTERLGSARELCAELEAIARAPLGASPTAGEEPDPYAGLAAFQERDAAHFFGRASAIEQIMTRLAEQPFLALVGSSGVGKSSLVRAGVIPALRRSGDAWEALVLRPGPRPLAVLVDLLAQLGDPDAQPARLRQEPGLLGVRARAYARRRRCRALLFVDQFEEVYTLAAPDEREALFACLAGAADDASAPVRVVIAIRHDFLDRVAASASAFAELVGRSTLLVGSLDRRGLGRALVAPAESLAFRFESDALVDEILDALAAAAAPLPILQFTATRLWEGRDRERRLLTEACYRGFGGVGGALASHADSVLHTLSSAEREHARALLLRLVTPERTRAVVTRRELAELGGATGELSRVADRLIAARLLTVEGTGGDDSTVELLHESLIQTWPTLARWLVEAQGDAQFLARLRGAAREWEATRRDEGLLWRGEAEEDARRWLARQRAQAAPPLADREARYLAAVVALGDRERRRRRQALIAVIASLSAGVLLVSALAIRASRAAAAAREERFEAERSAASARNATRMATAREHQGDPTTVLALLRELEPGETPRGWAELARWAPTAGVAEIVLHHPDAVWAAAFSPDGRRVATAPNDDTVWVWRAEGTGPPVVLRGHTAYVHKLAWSPDGRRVASASYDGTVRIWDPDGAGEPIVLRGHTDRVYTAAWSPDGARLVSASRDGTIRVWRLDGAGDAPPVVLRGHTDRVYAAAWSPDGAHVASASADRTVRVWRADGAGEPVVLRGHTDSVSWVAFSPDGRRVASTSFDTTLRVWDASGAGAPVVLRGHEANLYVVAWSPDGARLATASQDRTVRIWRADGAGEPIVLAGHGNHVYDVAWSPDGQRVISASWDKTVRVWRTTHTGPRVLRGHTGPVAAAALSPDGRRVVSASNDQTVRVWTLDEAAPSPPLIFQGHTDRVRTAAWSPDGQRVVSASFDSTLRVWRADGADEPRVLSGHADRVYGAAWSPDGRRVASASNDQTVRVWTLDDAGAPPPLVLRGHTDRVNSVAWSPDGARLVSAADDKTLRVWRADGAGEPLVLRGHGSSVAAAAFSPDGRRLASASNDKTVRVWDAGGGRPPRIFEGHDAAVTSVAWSPDGTHLVSASSDTTVRLWSADAASEPLVLHTTAEVAMAGWGADGQHIVAASEDRTITVWSDLSPLTGPDDPTLWAPSRYCMPLAVRHQLLNFSESQSRRDLERCERLLGGEPAAPPR